MILIGELARRTQLSVRTIRFYEEKGLIDAVDRDQNNNRLFDDDETVHWLNFIKYLRRTGMTVKNIQEYHQLMKAGPKTIPERIKILENQKAKVLADIEEKYAEIDQIDHKLSRYRKGTNGYV
ncbi:MerR family transcriptional regulator [Lentilactobacillus kosonis]|uniref:Transcriptional regulator, MerR family n=1 Tax=Lentilactobacillus kosonis TaxID=2810561 RepID=A0A401FMH4_9LACO|nr:MerR family transcriptional regulator [Lentilactobacillus kosonis]GAY73421.1 transcriptional regulator, MerR family [Lentilactobacillus kosonis]